MKIAIRAVYHTPGNALDAGDAWLVMSPPYTLRVKVVEAGVEGDCLEYALGVDVDCAAGDVCVPQVVEVVMYSLDDVIGKRTGGCVDGHVGLVEVV